MNYVIAIYTILIAITMLPMMIWCLLFSFGVACLWIEELTQNWRGKPWTQ